MSARYHANLCTCHHGQIAHRYLLGSQANDGECLAPQCWCAAFELEGD